MTQFLETRVIESVKPDLSKQGSPRGALDGMGSRGMKRTSQGVATHTSRPSGVRLGEKTTVTMRTTAAARARAHGSLLLTFGALLVLSIGLIGLVWTPPNGPSPQDMAGNVVVADPDAVPPSGVLAGMEVIDAAGERFVVPSVGLDVPLGELSAVGSEVSPPGFASAYLIRNRGRSPADAGDGTVFVVTHSLRNGGVAPGNSLIDVDRQTSNLSAGDEILVGSVVYTVTDSEIIAKSALASRTDIWSNAPGRLVVITCLQDPASQPSTANAVIIATLR